MDAAQHSKTFALLSALALAALLPGTAQAQTLLVNGATTAAVSVCAGQTPGASVAVTSSDGTTPIAFTISGVPAGLTAETSNGTTTATTVYLNVSNSALFTSSATITLTATSGGTGSVTITAAPSTCGPGSGGTGSGPVTASPTSITFSTPSTLSTNVILTNNTSSTASYSVSPSTSWLSVITNQSGNIAPNSSVTVPVQANPLGLAASTYSASLTVTSSATTQSFTVPVTFNVGAGYGSGNGSLTLTPNPAAMSYNTGGVTPTAFVSLTNTTAGTFSATIQSNSGNFLLIGPGGSGCSQGQIFNVPTSGGLALCTSSNIASLATGTYTATVLVTDANSATNTLTVNLTVNGSTSSNGLTVSTNSVSLSAAAGSTQSAQQSVTIGTNTAGTLSFNTTGISGVTASFSSNSISAGGQSTLTIYGNPSGLAAGTYTGTLTVNEVDTNNNAVGSVVINVSFTVGSGSGGSTSSTIVAPSSLAFAYEIGMQAPASQQVTLAASGAYNTTISYTSGQSSNWLTVTPSSGSGPSYPSISVNPAGLAIGTFNAQVTFTTSSGSAVINVTLTVSGSTVLYAFPSTINFSYSAGGNAPQTTFGVYASDNSSIGFVAASNASSANWLSVTTTGSNSVLLQTSPQNLANGVYTAYVSVSSTVGGVSVPVVLTVTGSTVNSGNLTFSTSSITLNAQPNGSSASSSITVTPPSGTTFTAGSSVSTGSTNWLSISPSGGQYAAATAFTVTANPSGLSIGTYSGNLIFTSNSGTQQTVPVSFVVSSSASGGSVTVSPTSLAFTYSLNGGVPAGLPLSIANSVSGTSTIYFTVSTTTQSGASWLSTTAGTNTVGTPASLTVNVSPTSLQAGTYTGSVVITPNGGNAVTVPVTLVVQGLPTVTATPGSLNLSYTVGGSAPTGTIQVNGSAASLNFTASATSASGWLSVTPASGNTGTSGTALQVGVDTSSLSAGTYTGTITVAGTNGAGGSTTINVSLTVTAPLPTIVALVNGASFAAGAVSPGEIVTIGGTAMGPGTGVGLQTDAAGANVLTTLGGVQVLFSGIPAPLIYVSATQINCVVPYGIAGILNPFVQVKYLNQTSNAFSLTAAASAPGIFTANAQGSGPGAIVNQSGSVNGPNNPAPKGSVVTVYMTGEGQTSPPGGTGKVTCPPNVACTVSQIPVPLLPVAVTLNGAPATYLFAGEAPGFISGLLQVNVQIPANAPSGNLSLVISIGNNSSQQNVTVSVQ